MRTPAVATRLCPWASARTWPPSPPLPFTHHHHLPHRSCGTALPAISSEHAATLWALTGLKEQRSKRVEAPRESPLRKAASLCGRGCGRAGARLWGARGTAAASCLPDEALCLLASANSALSVGPQRGRLSYWTHGRVSRPRPARGRSRRCRARGCRRGTQPECAELAHRRRGREGGSLSPGLGCLSLAGDLPPFWMHCPLRWGGAAVAPVALGGIRARPALPPKQVWLQRSTLLTKPSTPLWRRVRGGRHAWAGDG